MTEIEKRGRLIAIGIAYTLAATNLFGVAITAAVRGVQYSGFLMAQTGISLFIAWCLFRGQNWARWYLVFTLPLGSIWLVASTARRLAVPSQFVTLIGDVPSGVDRGR